MTEATQIINDSKNIYLISSEEPEAIASTMALFYTLKDLGKNVNLVTDGLPETLRFLTPSLDYISCPKNFVLSIPNSVAKISQIYYEKNDEALKVHLTLESGAIKKDNIAFYFQEAKPDLIITVGIKDYQKELSVKLESFGFLLESPILNIDASQANQKFGKINLLGESSISELVYGLAENITKQSAVCLLTGLVIYTENFTKNLTADIFSTTSNLMKKGADLKDVVKNLNK